MLEAVVGVALRAILASVFLGGVLAAIVLVATRALALNAATRHALWTTALIATALMPLAGIGVSVLKGAEFQGAPPQQGARPPRVAWGPRSELATSTVTRRDGSALAPSSGSRQQASSLATNAEKSASTGPVAPSFFSGITARFAGWTPRMSRNVAFGIVGIWLLGALIGLIGLAASIARVRGLKRRSSPLDSALADELPWLTEVGPGREIYLRLSFETETPVAIGFRRPVILIPTELATADGLTAIEQLILHEHAHLRRYDDWTNLVQRTIERVFWFNPIVWLVGRRIALEREIASDDAVVEKTGEAHQYATSLWRLVREMRMPEHAVVAPGALLTRKQITIRIEQLLDKRRGQLHRSPGAALGVAVAGVLAVAFVATSAPAVELPAAPEPALAVATEQPRSAMPESVRPRTGNSHQTLAVTEPATGSKNATSAPAPAPHPQPTPIVHERIVKVLVAVPGQLPRMPALPPPVVGSKPVELVPPPTPTASLTPETVARIRSSSKTAALAAAEAMRANDSTGLTVDVQRTIRDAMAAIPRQIADERNPHRSKRTSFDGVKISREIVAACSACSFRNADLRGLDLHELRINADDFSGADMRGANLASARLSGVSLRGTNLDNADLRGTLLSGVELRGASFEGAQLEGIRMSGVSLRRVNLRGTALRSVILNCSGCDLGGLDLHGQDLHGVSLSGADLNHADLRDANLSGAHFMGVDLNGANLSGADLSNARFDGCDLSNINLSGARTAGLILHSSGSDG